MLTLLFSPNPYFIRLRNIIIKICKDLLLKIKNIALLAIAMKASRIIKTIQIIKKLLKFRD
jgi:hypothetical protein